MVYQNCQRPWHVVFPHNAWNTNRNNRPITAATSPSFYVLFPRVIYIYIFGRRWNWQLHLELVFAFSSIMPPTVSSLACLIENSMLMNTFQTSESLVFSGSFKNSLQNPRKFPTSDLLLFLVIWGSFTYSLIGAKQSQTHQNLTMFIQIS